MRNFANGVADTQISATGVIKDMGKVYSGYSYQALVAAWGRMSKSHMADLDAACGVVAGALDAAAVVIEVTKVAVLAELAGLAASYAAAMAAAIATDGLSVAIEQAIAAAARKICQAMEQALIGYVLTEVIGKAIEPLGHAIDRMVHGIVDNVAGEVLGPPPGPAAQTLHIEPDEVIDYSSCPGRVGGRHPAAGIGFRGQGRGTGLHLTHRRRGRRRCARRKSRRGSPRGSGIARREQRPPPRAGGSCPADGTAQPARPCPHFL